MSNSAPANNHGSPPLRGVSIRREDAEGHDQEDKTTPLSTADGKDWDGKLRIDKSITLANPEALSDPEYSDEANVAVGEQIHADEDLLDDFPPDSSEIDLIHARIASIPALGITTTRFPAVSRLSLRQNAIPSLAGVDALPPTLTELDLYDNLITTIPAQVFASLSALTSLDLSFNKLKHIKNLVPHLPNLTDLYLIQNKITRIENLAGLSRLRNLELAANRIHEIAGLEELSALEELWLGKNKISSLTGIETLARLRVLSTQSNRIRELPAPFPPLERLEELYLSHNAITSLAPLAGLPSLRVLDISSNAVATLDGLGPLAKLEELWASYNKLDNFADVEKFLGDKQALETVYLEGNPLQLQGPAVYRNKVRLALPQIKQIDATYVRVD